MIRRATAHDADAVRDLARQLGYPHGGNALEEICVRDDHAVFVAVEAERVAGFIHVSVMLSLESDTYAEIRALVVDEAERGRGLGEQLVRAAEEWSRSRRVEKVRVRSNVIRDHARRFYERLGYKVVKTQNVFDKIQ
ncbi:MAG TPA: GNAT family N-acetyltransferase [Thermoanaerobaculia bacterium]|nr:GNAT family N-acetyltransferase [Thermoanaerobaculia bacterium]